MLFLNQTLPETEEQDFLTPEELMRQEQFIQEHQLE